MKILLTGSSGMIGKGVLLELLDHELIDEITVINRKHIEVKSPKIKEIILSDFSTIDTQKDAIGHIDACFHCMGVSAMGLSEETYTRLTFEISRVLADTVYSINPDSIFVYVSGVGTDSSESRRQMWARVKGRTENYILNKGFKKSYMFRPGMIIPEKGIQSRTRWYNWIYKITRPIFPLLLGNKNVTTTGRIGQAMINCLRTEEQSGILDPIQINQLANQKN